MDKKVKLVRKAINGNEKAFTALVEEISERLYKTAFIYVRNKEDALDVLQETTFKAFVSIQQLKQPEYFQTWITKILIRTAFELLRKKKNLILDNSLLEKKTEDTMIETKIDLINGISKLSQDYQTVIILFYYHDLPLSRIAKITDKPENTVKTSLRRAKIELKKILEGVNDFGQRVFS